jgi:predicted DNA-binding transcriptional regulator AlpA
MRVRRIQSGGKELSSAVESRGLPVITAPVLKEADAARYLGMSRAWLKKSRTERFRSAMDAPPFVRCGARRIVYRREDLDAWQEGHLEVVGDTARA